MAVVATPQTQRARSSATLHASHLDQGALWVLELSGEADIATLAMLGEELAVAVAMNREHLVVDVTSLRFCDVRSAHMILTARTTGGMDVKGATGSVKRSLDLVTSLQRHPWEWATDVPLGDRCPFGIVS